MTDEKILQSLDKLAMELPFDEIYVKDTYIDVHELISEIKERLTKHKVESKNCNNCGDINCAAYGDGEQFSCKNWMDKDTGLIDWMHDDITWCRRKCPNKECFRNQVNRRLKAGLISVADMYKEGECPKEAE